MDERSTISANEYRRSRSLAVLERREAAEKPETSDDIIQKLLEQDGGFLERLATMETPDTSEELLEKMLEHGEGVQKLLLQEDD